MTDRPAPARGHDRVMLGAGALSALALAYPLLLAASYTLKPSVAINAAFWPPLAVAYCAYRFVPAKHWYVVVIAQASLDAAVVAIVSYLAAGVRPDPHYLAPLAFANAAIALGMGAASAVPGLIHPLRRGVTAVTPLWLFSMGVGATPGCLLSAWVHARHAHAPLVGLDVISRVLACVLTVVACCPLAFGLLRGFREPAPAPALRWEFWGVLASSLALGLILVLVRWPLNDHFTELLVVAIPVFWLAVRFSQRAVAVAVAAAACGMALVAAHGAGQFPSLMRDGSWADGIVSTQILLLLVCGGAILINRSVLETRRLLDSYARKHVQLLAYAAALDKADASARRAAAADLHDGVGQILAGLGMILGAMRRHARDASPLQVMLDQALEAARDAQTGVRHMIHDLSPPELDVASMPEILGLIARMFDSRYRFRVETAFDGDSSGLRAHTPLIYRIIRELLYNAYKHSQTSEARVEVSVGATHIDIDVSDRGVGFAAGSAAPNPDAGFGMAHLAERVHTAGGTLEVDSAPGRGCRIRVRLPLDTASRELQPGTREARALAPERIH